MRFYSTKKNSPSVGLTEAIKNGLAPDGGLYLPQNIPSLPRDFFALGKKQSFPDIAFEVSKKIFQDDLPQKILRSIVDEAFNFDVPLVNLEDNLSVLELFHGPTLAFKDFAARFMARVFGYMVRQSQNPLTILVATSGDTGSAVAHGFLNMPNIKVVLLYPKGQVSGIQKQQLTSMGVNITALEVSGNFDDCQKMVKQAFLDKQLKLKLTLASANSINIARLLPQTFYYVYLCAQLSHPNLPIVVSVPSGNFGNLTAGLMAKRMGAPIYKFVAATNRNNSVPNYLNTGKFKAKPSLPTISNAMDVGNPSNFSRMRELYQDNVEAMRRDIFGASFSDRQTKQAMADVFKKYKYILDPHGAVAYLGLVEYQKKSPKCAGVFLETAHPAKFPETLPKIKGLTAPLPDKLKIYLGREKQVISIKNTFSDLKKFLLN